MVVETLLRILVGAAFAWLFVYSAVLFGAKHALRDYFNDSKNQDAGRANEMESDG